MSAPVDVLAVMDVLADECALASVLGRDREDVDKFGRIASDAVKARAAVAELIAAAKSGRAMLRESAKQHRLAGDMGHATHCEAISDHLDAALRRCTGEGA